MPYRSLIFFTFSVAIVSVSYALIHPGSEDKNNQIEQKIVAPAISDDLEDDRSLKDNILLVAKTKPLSLQKFRFKHEWKKHVIQRDESLSQILSELRLDPTDVLKLTHAGSNKINLAKLTAGKIIRFKTTKGINRLEVIEYQKNSLETIIATRTANNFVLEKKTKDLQRRLEIREGTIHSSLFSDGIKAGLTENMIMQLADIFAWDIDFALNIQDGDQFRVLLDKLYLDDKEINSGIILAAEFTNKGRRFAAARYQDPKGYVSYYSPDGRNMRKAFIRTPVDFARISSGFNLGRKHPKLNQIRAHKGVDYAAKTGTPVKTTGAGKITYLGTMNGYGNVIVIEHGHKYSTLYAHLSRFRNGLKNHQRVTQGHIIGYVGQSGLATGPHLHYEFRINGIHRNPLTVELPSALSIKKSYLADFKEKTTPYLVKLVELHNKQLASNNH